MGVFNLLKFRSCKRIGYLALKYSTESKPIRLHSKICNYVMQKQDMSLVLAKTSELQEIYREKKKMSAVDLDLCIKVNSCSFNEVLLLLNSFAVFDFEFCMNSLFYQVFFENLKKGVVEKADWDQLIQIIYYIAHRSVQAETKPMVVKCLNKLNERSEVSKADYRDICVVSEAAFKTDTTITSQNILDRMKEVSKKEFYNLASDTIWLGMLFKGFRVAGKVDVEFLLEMTELLKKSQLTESFDLMTVKQLINYYSDALVKDEVVLDTFIRSSSKYLRKWLSANGNKIQQKEINSNLRKPRIKNLGRMLYSLTTLDHSIDPRLLEAVFVPCFLKLVKKRDGHKLETVYEISSLVSFWHMGYNLERIGDACKTVVENLERIELRPRDVNLAYRLLVIIALQYPKLLTKTFKDIKTSLAQQDAEVTIVPHYNEGSLKFLKKLIDNHKDDFKIAKTYLEAPVEASNILGLTIIANGEKTHIDVLEKEHCLATADAPNCQMVYKIRLLEFVPKVNRHIIGLTDEQIEELHLVDEWGDKCVPSGGWTFEKDAIGRRNGRKPKPEMRDVINKTMEEAKNAISKKLVEKDFCLTIKTIQSSLDILRGAVMIVYPMGLPPHDPIRMEFENNEDLIGTQASLEVLDPARTTLWFSGKEIMRGKKLSDYLGKNEKTKIVCKLQKAGQGAPQREPVMSEQERKLMMAQAYKRQEELKKLDENTDDQYLDSTWADSSGLKNSLQGLSDISWRPK